MANKLYEESYIQDIADAIREKNGTSTTYKVSQMGAAVRAIEGSGGDQSDSEKFKSLLNKTITEITADDLSGMSRINQYSFYQCKKLTKVIIPNGIISIGAYAFYNCTSIADINIPSSIINIASSAFYQCTSLTDIYLYPTTPPSLGNTYSIPDTTTIHVPIGSGDAYKSATNWSSYSDRIVEDITIT